MEMVRCDRGLEPPPASRVSTKNEEPNRITPLQWGAPEKREERRD